MTNLIWKLVTKGCSLSNFKAGLEQNLFYFRAWLLVKRKSVALQRQVLLANNALSEKVLWQLPTPWMMPILDVFYAISDPDGERDRGGDCNSTRCSGGQPCSPVETTVWKRPSFIIGVIDFRYFELLHLFVCSIHSEYGLINDGWWNLLEIDLLPWENYWRLRPQQSRRIEHSLAWRIIRKKLVAKFYLL